MRWGVRRGPPYPIRNNASGKKRRQTEASQNKKISGDKSRSPVERDVKNLSDEELRNIINRLQMEMQYKELTQKQRNDGVKFVEELLATSTKDLTKKYILKYGSMAIDSIIKKAMSK